MYLKKTKVAVIGCGTIARKQHIPNYAKHPLAEIKYVVDSRIELAEEMAGTFNVPFALADYKAVLKDDEVDAVSICTPNDTHAPLSIEFLKAGKHVLCEKPAATHAALAAEMKRTADEFGRILNIGVVNRFHTAVNKIKQMVERGELGEIYHVNCSFRAHRSIPGLGGPFTTKSKSGGGVLIDWGVHFLDLIFYILNQPKVSTVSGQTYGKLGKRIEDYTYINMWAGPPNLAGTCDVEDFVTGLIRTSRGTISLNGAWAQNIGEDAMFVEFLGDKAGIKWQYGGNFKMYTSADGMLYEIVPAFQIQDMFYEEIDDFIQSTRNGTKSRANIDYTLLATEVIEAIYRSSEFHSEIRM